MTAEEVLNLVIIEIEQLGIEMKTGSLTGAAAYISYNCGWGVWDPERASLFDLCHELFHVKNGDVNRCSDNDWNNPCEKIANDGAIRMLWGIFEQHDGDIEGLDHFIKITGCPEKRAKIVILQSKIRTWDKEEVREQVNYYLKETSEEPDSWNLYKIMDACHIDYEWEYLVKCIVNEKYLERVG